MNNTKSSQTDFHLHNSFVFWITRLSSVMKEQFNQQLQEQDVTWPQWMILNVLHHQLAKTPAQIADNIGVDRSAVTRLLDRCSIKIHITETGQNLIAELNDAAVRHQEAFLRELHPTEMRAFKGNVQKLLRAGGVETAQAWRHM
jgi:DNA-binding MarR family transcriptional regulator